MPSRNLRSGVEDRWYKRNGEQSASYDKVTRWRARYVGPDGREHSGHFDRKREAQRWVSQQTAAIETSSWTDPVTARTTMHEWSRTWLEGYGSRRSGTVRQAQVHLDKINAAFGDRRLDSIRASEIKNWLAGLKTDGHADSYLFALHSRLAQLYTDAVQDGLVARSPVSRRTSPGQGKPRPYVATTEQVWGLHDAIGDRHRAGVLLAAFSGLRLAEVCGLRLCDIDFMRGIITPTVQYPADPLKTEISRTPVPIPNALALLLSAHAGEYGHEYVMTSESGVQMGPWQLQRAFRAARARVDSLPDGFRFHDLRHFYASALIASGADVKIVQTRLRHASAKTTLDVYAHLFPDSDDSTRAAIGDILASRQGVAESLRNQHEI